MSTGYVLPRSARRAPLRCPAQPGARGRRRGLHRRPARQRHRHRDRQCSSGSSRRWCRSATSTAAPAPAINSYQREEKRRVQTALNYFGFPAGDARRGDGANSRAAIGQYQAFARLPADRHADGVRAVLPDSPPTTARSSAGHRRRRSWRPAARGPAGCCSLTARSSSASRAAAAVAPPAIAGDGPRRAGVAAGVGPGPRPRGRSRRLAAAAPRRLPASCRRGGDSLAGSATGSAWDQGNGGGHRSTAMVDPAAALDEQFCVARSHAIDQAKASPRGRGFTTARCGRSARPSPRPWPASPASPARPGRVARRCRVPRRHRRAGGADERHRADLPRHRLLDRQRRSRARLGAGAGRARRGRLRRAPSAST